MEERCERKKRNKGRTRLLLGMVEEKFVVNMRESIAKGRDIWASPEWTCPD